MKTTEELKSIKEEFETPNKDLAELTEKELEQVSGGMRIQHNMTAPNTNRQLGDTAGYFEPPVSPQHTIS